MLMISGYKEIVIDLIKKFESEIRFFLGIFIVLPICSVITGVLVYIDSHSFFILFFTILTLVGGAWGIAKTLTLKACVILAFIVVSSLVFVSVIFFFYLEEKSFYLS